MRSEVRHNLIFKKFKILYIFFLEEQENLYRENDLLSSNTNRTKRRILEDIGSQNKIIKLSEDVIKKSPAISTKSFYSTSAVKVPVPYKIDVPKKKNTQSKKRTTKPKKKGGFKVFGLINKGVGHKIFKPRPIKKTTSPTVKNIVKIVKSYSNDIKAIEKKAEEGISAQQLLRIKNIMKNMKNPIEMARPLSVNITTAVETATRKRENIDDEEYQDPPGKRKLLKTKHTSNNKYRVTDKISATFCKGKISFMANKDDKQFKLYEELENTDETIEIDGIINRLKESTIIQIPSDSGTLIPVDPAIIEQQQNMLDFLICNNICTEENIKIFINEPENHKEEASKILNDLIVITTESVDIENTEMFVEETPLSPTSQMNNLTSSLKIVHSNEENQEKIFPIFKKGFQAPLTMDELQLVKPVNKIKWKPCGTDQLQIDAGQKQFGAKECVECGFIYSVSFFFFFLVEL